MAAGCVLALLAPRAGAQFYDRKPKKPDTPKQRDDLRDYRDEADKVLAPLTDRAPGAANPEDVGRSTWTIVLVAFTGTNQADNAAVGLHKVHHEAGLTSAYLERRDKATVIAYGSYPAPDDPRAQADLQRIRELKVNGVQPFNGALLTPPAPEHLAGSLPEFDLRNAKKIFGPTKALYTLQVAIYGKGDRSPANRQEIAEFRKAAEQAAVLLRRDGELAFYYHAPERSMVTIGVFGQADYNPQKIPVFESFELVQLRERHPLNLLNGQGIREIYQQRDGSEATRMQPSKLVAVPED